MTPINGVLLTPIGCLDSNRLSYTQRRCLGSEWVLRPASWVDLRCSRRLPTVKRLLSASLPRA